jgi:CRISPR system Cascade subunit CasE
LWKLFPSAGEGRSFLFREEVAREQMPFFKGVRGEPVFYTVSGAKPQTEHPFFAVESKPYAPLLQAGDRLAFRLRANPTVARKRDGRKNSIRHDVVMDAQYHLLRELAAEMGVEASGGKFQVRKSVFSAWQSLPDTREIDEKLRRIIEENERFAEMATMYLNPARLLDIALKARMNKALEAWFLEKGERLGFTVVQDDRKGRLKFQAEGYQWHSLHRKGKTAGFSSVDFEGEIEVIDAELLSKGLFDGIGPAKGFGCGLMLVRRT